MRCRRDLTTENLARMNKREGQPGRCFDDWNGLDFAHWARHRLQVDSRTADSR